MDVINIISTLTCFADVDMKDNQIVKQKIINVTNVYNLLYHVRQNLLLILTDVFWLG